MTMTNKNTKKLNEYLSAGLRFDGRKLDEYRKIEIRYDVSETSEGSAQVKIGNTEVIAGVKLLVDKPYPDKPEEGSLMVGAELLPMSSPAFESGPPGIESIELARVIDRGIRESKAIDNKKLMIKKGEKVWIVSVDVCTINDAGNLLDASGIAALAAIKNTVFPEYDGEHVDYKKKTDKKLPIVKTPIAVTVYKLGNHLFVDPTEDEQDVYDARLTVTITEDGGICALQKGGSGPLSETEVIKMIETAQKIAPKIRAAL